MMLQNRDSILLADLHRELLGSRINIRQLKNGHGSQCLRSITALLPLGENLLLLLNPDFILLRPCGLFCLHTGSFLIPLFLSQSLGGYQNCHHLVLIAQQSGANQLLEITLVHPLLQIIQCTLHQQILGRITIVEPALQHIQTFIKGSGQPAAVLVPHLESKTVKAGFQTPFIQTILRQISEDTIDCFLDQLHFVPLGVPDLPGNPVLLNTVVNLELHILTKPGRKNCLLQRRIIVAGQIIPQNCSRIDFLLLIKLTQHMAARDNGAVGIILLRADLIGNHCFLVSNRLLHRDGEIGLLTGKCREDTIQFR